MRLTWDSDAWIRAGEYVIDSPEVPKIDNDGPAIHPEAVDKKCVREVMAMCPQNTLATE